MDTPLAILLIAGLCTHFIYRGIRVVGVEVWRHRTYRKLYTNLDMVSSVAFGLWVTAQACGFLFILHAWGYLGSSEMQLAASTIGFFALPGAIFIGTVCGIQAATSDMRAPIMRLTKPRILGRAVLALWALTYLSLAVIIVCYAVSALATWRWLAVPTVAMTVILVFVALMKGRFIVSRKVCTSGKRLSLLIWEKNKGKNMAK